MIGKASLSLDKASEQIEGMVQQGTAFARMEEVIDAASLSDPHKAALWLLGERSCHESRFAVLQ